MAMKKQKTALSDAYMSMKAIEGSRLIELISEVVANPGHSYEWTKLSEAEKLERAAGNPFRFAIMEEVYYPTVCRTHRDMAEIFLWQLETVRPGVIRGTIGHLFPERHIGKGVEYISLRDYIRLSTEFAKITSLPDFLFFKPDIETITWYFFLSNQMCFDSAIDKVCSIVSHGLPLFEKLDDETFRRLDFNHRDYVYLSGKAAWGETGGASTENAGTFPGWSENYYFCCAHFVAYDKYFRSEGRRGLYHSPEAENALRVELRKTIGLETDNWDSEEIKVTKGFPLVEYVNQVLSRSCPGLFNGDAKSWPKQEAISAWLQMNRGLSKRQADAVALIATQSK